MRMQKNWMLLATLARVTSGRRIADLQRAREF